MQIRSYPVWLSLFILLGPIMMIGWAGIGNYSWSWAVPFVGAGMVVVVLLYLSNRLHEHMEEVTALRELLQSNRTGSTAKAIDQKA
jgi:hypothetical protein